MTHDPETADISDVLAKYNRVEISNAATWPVNKASVLACLAAAGITHVIVTFDGSGDSGQIENIEAKAGDVPVDLPRAAIALQAVDYATETCTTSDTALDDAIESLVYQCLQQTHCGWENNEGAFGEVTFDVAAGTVTLDYNERFETSEFTQHIL